MKKFKGMKQVGDHLFVIDDPVFEVKVVLDDLQRQVDRLGARINWPTAPDPELADIHEEILGIMAIARGMTLGNAKARVKARSKTAADNRRGSNLKGLNVESPLVKIQRARVVKIQRAPTRKTLGSIADA